MKTPFHSRDPREWEKFLSLVEQAVAENQLDCLLAMLLTPDERNTLGLRVEIVQKLLENTLPQREIQQQLNTSAATITRGSNMLKTVDPKALSWIHEKLLGQ